MKEITKNKKEIEKGVLQELEKSLNFAAIKKTEFGEDQIILHKNHD